MQQVTAALPEQSLCYKLHTGNTLTDRWTSHFTVLSSHEVVLVAPATTVHELLALSSLHVIEPTTFRLATRTVIRQQGTDICR